VTTRRRRSTVDANPAARVTLRVLADQLGLSPASVSLVLNRAPAARAIPPATQDRIRAAAEASGYRPNTIAKSLRHRRTLTVGVMVPEISEGYSALVMSGIEDALLQAGYLYFVASHRHRADLVDEYPRLMLDRSVDGLILVDTPIGAPLPVPIVAVSGHHQVDGVTNIVVDHGRAAAQALAHLRALGHRRVAFIKGQPFSSDTAVRWRTIRAAARAEGIAVDPALVGQLEGNSPRPDLGYAATRALLRVRPRATALFAFNDISALGAIRAIRETGLRVPEDVSVLGFDDIPSAAYQHPGLTTIRQPLYEMGLRAADVLVARIERPADPMPRTISLEPSLVVRGTTARAR
jgi:DNA-binding LacI/PurR family transcriptional regulator